MATKPPTSKQWLGSCLNDAVYPTAAMAVLLLPISPLRPYSPCCPSSQGGGSTRSDAHLEVPSAITLKGDRWHIPKSSTHLGYILKVSIAMRIMRHFANIEKNPTRAVSNVLASRFVKAMMHLPCS